MDRLPRALRFMNSCFIGNSEPWKVCEHKMTLKRRVRGEQIK